MIIDDGFLVSSNSHALSEASYSIASVGQIEIQCPQIMQELNGSSNFTILFFPVIVGGLKNSLVGQSFTHFKHLMHLSSLILMIFNYKHFEVITF